MPHPAPLSPLFHADEGDIFGPIGNHILFVLRAPARHKALSAFCFLSAVALGVAAAWALPSRYEVQASILAQPTPLIGALSNPGLNREGDSPARAAREIVIRRDNLVALCRQTDFVNRYRQSRTPAARARDWLNKTVLRKERTDEQLLDDLVSSLEERLWVAVSPEGTVSIGFTWSDPEIAYQIVQAAVQSFLETRSASEIGAMGDAIAILHGHDTQVQSAIAAAIEQLDAKERSLRAEAAPRPRPIALPASAPRPDAETQQLGDLLAARRRALAEVDDIRRRRLAELQLELSQQLTVFAPGHPTVEGTRQAIASLESPSPQAERLRSEIAQLEHELAARARETAGDASGLPSPPQGNDGVAVARLRLAANDDPALAYERGQLEGLLRQHSGLLERIESARIELDAARTAFQQRYSIITPPRRPRGPMKPYRLMYALGGVFLGIAAACGLAALVDVCGGRVVERWQLEKGMSLPVIVEIRR